jgi:hypothetical protein
MQYRLFFKFLYVFNEIYVTEVRVEFDGPNVNALGAGVLIKSKIVYLV